MPTDDPVARHYTHGELMATISKAIQELGKTPETITIDDLAPLDEFHIGGRQATEAFLRQLPLGPETDVLDVGCGLGGAARFAASRFQCRVVGIDLTQEFVETGQALCEWLGLGEQVTLRQASALSMPFEEESFDAAYMLHVGMNIPDKEGLCSEVARVLKPGGVFGIYDVMQTLPEPLAFPVPWAETEETSATASPDEYRAALQAAGFKIAGVLSRRDYALEFFAELMAKAELAQGPPPLGLHLLMGETRAEKVQNMIDNIREGRIAPVEMLARK